MGMIFGATRDLTTEYQNLRVYRQNDTPGFGGWGVRNRPDTVSGSLPIMCTAYPIPYGTKLKYVSFYLGDVPGAAGADASISIGIWRLSRSDPDNYYRVAALQITEDDIEGGWSTGKHTLEIDEIVVGNSQEFASGTAYYLGFTCSGALIAKTSSGCSGGLEFLGAGKDINDPGIAVSYSRVENFSDMNDAYSIEVWGTVSAWDAIDHGGTIIEDNTDWQTTSGGSYPYIHTDWTDVQNTFANDGATATADGDLIFDLGGGIEPIYPWDSEADGDVGAVGTPHIPDADTEFPDYSVYGVRALYTIRIKGTLNDNSDSLLVLWCDLDTSAVPDVGDGWQNLGNITTSAAPEAFDETFDVPQIARWIKITQSGHSTDDVDYIQVKQLADKVIDGEFNVDHTQSTHIVWVDNYRDSDTVYKLSVANAAGAESELSEPLSNRMNID